MSQGIVEFQLGEDMEFANAGEFLGRFALLFAKVFPMMLQTRDGPHQPV
jgi:hypothetical protein